MRNVCTVVGCSTSAVCSGKEFRRIGKAVIDKARQVAADARVDELREYYDGRVVVIGDTHLSGASSRPCEMGPSPSILLSGERLFRSDENARQIHMEIPFGERRTPDAKLKTLSCTKISVLCCWKAGQSIAPTSRRDVSCRQTAQMRRTDSSFKITQRINQSSSLRRMT